MKLGAIDVGSNAIRVLIAEVKKPLGVWRYSKIAYLRLPVRLGDDVFEKGSISDAKIERFLDGMKIFKAMLSFYKVDAYRAVATSAMRDSNNSKRIQSMVFKETGITLDVISGKEEAELVYLTFQLMHNIKTNYLLVDVGGGSTEITLFQDNQIHAAKSFQIGSVRMLKNKVKPEEWDKMRDWIATEIAPHNPQRIFGSGGTINSVHKVLENSSKDPVTIHQLDSLVKTLEGLSLEERLIRFPIKEDRADVIVPAMQIYTFVLNSMNLTEVFVPKMGLSDGVLLDLYRDKTL
ncbi:MAG: exopolyphosphatase [Flavobacteriia bacterium]|jgi:exopolyphosphatase/guanosine-5'-triphosphate,3'-diphosphate pyrophosphatase|nr:exopolyphosphatase [Flavobacteriia bacterium]